jgi:hypothetical protein
MIRLLVGVLVVLAIVRHDAVAESPINALWNESDGKVGLWVYPVSGECPDLREKAKPLVFSVRDARLEYVVADLDYCFLLPERTGMPINRCRRGNLRLLFDSASNRYGGRYSFEMADGTKREGEFNAQYCPKGPPPKLKNETTTHA